MWVRKIRIHRRNWKKMGHEKERTPVKHKVKLTQKDMAENNREQAEKRMNTGDGGLAKHDKTCPNNIQWQESCIIAK